MWNFAPLLTLKVSYTMVTYILNPSKEKFFEGDNNFLHKVENYIKSIDKGGLQYNFTLGVISFTPDHLPQTQDPDLENTYRTTGGVPLFTQK